MHVDGIHAYMRRPAARMIGGGIYLSTVYDWLCDSFLYTYRRTLRPKITVTLEFKICPTKNATLTHLPQKTKKCLDASIHTCTPKK